MPEFDSQNTTDPSAPTTSDLKAMWLAQREAELATADRRDYERFRSRIAAIYGEAA